MPLEILQADITTLTVEAIVNAANAALSGGGGVDGAIHRAAGPELHAACYRNSLALADAHGVARIAFPAIGCGVFGYPPDQAARIAIDTVRAHAPSGMQVIFCAFDSAMAERYRKSL